MFNSYLLLCFFFFCLQICGVETKNVQHLFILIGAELLNGMKYTHTHTFEPGAEKKKKNIFDSVFHFVENVLMWNLLVFKIASQPYNSIP